MRSGYRLKSPIFITLARDGFAREESIRYLMVRGPIAAKIGDPIGGEPINSSAKVEAFMRMLDLRDRDLDEDLRFLAYGDLDVAVDDAYREARWRALDYIWGKNQVENPDARCPRSFDAPTEKEAINRMIAAFGFDFTPQDDRDEGEE